MRVCVCACVRVCMRANLVAATLHCSCMQALFVHVVAHACVYRAKVHIDHACIGAIIMHARLHQSALNM